MNAKTVIRFRYEHLRNEAHVSYHEAVTKLIEKFDPKFLEIVSVYSQYKTAYNDEVSVLDMVQKSEFTQEIEEQDEVRDDIFYGFKTAVKSALNHYSQDLRKAAKKVEIVLDSYGNIARKSFDQETAAIDDIIRELNDSRKVEIDQLGLQMWLVMLSKENDTFKRIMESRYSQSANRPTLRMRNTRQIVDSLFRGILNFIEAYTTLNGMQKHENFLKELNAVSERYKNLLAQAEGKRKASNN